MAVLAHSVLGPCELRRDGTVIPIPAGKTTELLIRLALDAGVPVRVDRLIDDLWGAEGVPTQRNTMQAKVSKLRRALLAGLAYLAAMLEIGRRSFGRERGDTRFPTSSP